MDLCRLAVLCSLFPEILILAHLNNTQQTKLVNAMAERTNAPAGASATNNSNTGSDAPAWTKAQDDAAEKRKAIQAIMRDTTLTELERRKSIECHDILHLIYNLLLK